MSFCNYTFNWGDYITQVWDLWYVDPNGKLFVADLDIEKKRKNNRLTRLNPQLQFHM